MPVRSMLKRIYRSLMIFVTLALGVGAFLAYWYATPGNGLLLVSAILAILTLMAGLSINKLEWRDEQAETYRGIMDDVRSRFGGLQVNRGSQPGGTATFTFGGGMPVNVDYAEPEVHRVDNEMVAEAKRMTTEGAPIDDICRMVDPGHDRNDPIHQEAFRRIVRAMIEQS